MIEPEEDPLAVSAEAVRLLSPEGSSLRAEVLSSHARILSAYGRYEEAQTVGLEALTLAEKLDLRVLASDVITTLSGLKKAGPPDALRTALREAVRRAEASGALQAELRARFLLGRSHDDHAEWDDAERWYRSTLARGTDAHLPWAPSVFDARWELARRAHLRAARAGGRRRRLPQVDGGRPAVRRRGRRHGGAGPALPRPGARAGGRGPGAAAARARRLRPGSRLGGAGRGLRGGRAGVRAAADRVRAVRGRAAGRRLPGPWRWSGWPGSCRSSSPRTWWVASRRPT